MKQKEALGSEVACLRSDRDRQLLQVRALSEEVEKYKESTGKYCAQLDSMEASANNLEELKGNIRVLCRVRPLLADEATSDSKVISFPTSMETQGRGIDLCQNGKKHSFSYDKVFIPDASQEDVFVEISQLVESALDGYKVCIFSYGQTGSGKTYTMMGTPGIPDHKGLIPRSLEQVFETRQILQSQGWKYEMQVSMLEIYNETIRDLLAPNRSGFDASRLDNAGKQYTINHDAHGNTSVSDLTIVDVRSSREVSYLLERAAQSSYNPFILFFLGHDNLKMNCHSFSGGSKLSFMCVIIFKLVTCGGEIDANS